jgi:hypothetical protein
METVECLLVSGGKACAAQMDSLMVNISCQRRQIDEVWSFTYCKQSNVLGAT